MELVFHFVREIGTQLRHVVATFITVQKELCIITCYYHGCYYSAQCVKIFTNFRDTSLLRHQTVAGAKLS